MAMLAGPPESLRVPLTGVTHWQQELDAPPVPTMGGVEQCGGAPTSRVDFRMTNEGGDSDVVTVPRGVF